MVPGVLGSEKAEMGLVEGVGLLACLLAIYLVQVIWVMRHPTVASDSPLRRSMMRSWKVTLIAVAPVVLIVAGMVAISVIRGTAN